jgi:hypothetical protein
LQRVRLDAPWRGRWAELACALLREDLGTAIAYEAPDGAVVVNPRGARQVEAVALFVILDDAQETLLAARLPAALRAAAAAGAAPAEDAPAVA